MTTVFEILVIKPNEPGYFFGRPLGKEKNFICRNDGN